MRVFIAIDLPKNLKGKIFEVSQIIRKKFPCKLVEKENLHLTLVFLGDKKEEEVERIKKAVADATSRFGKIFLSVGNLEFFPNSRPRGIWFKVEGETEKLRELHKKIIDNLTQTGIQVEDLRFTPHICICRFKGRAKTEIEKINFEEIFFANKVTVFESKLSSRGPSYFKLAEFELE